MAAAKNFALSRFQIAGVKIDRVGFMFLEDSVVVAAELVAVNGAQVVSFSSLVAHSFLIQHRPTGVTS